MMAQNSNTAHRWNGQRQPTRGQTKMTIDLEAERVLQDSALIDQVIALAFERLGQVAVELRICETAAATHSVT
jgi:hypothetical protein